MRSARSGSTPTRSARASSTRARRRARPRSVAHASAAACATATRVRDSVHPRLLLRRGEQHLDDPLELRAFASTRASASRYSSGPTSRRSASSASARSFASGVRSSCDSSAESRRSCRRLAASRSSSASSVDGEPRQLVVRLAEPEAAVEIVSLQAAACSVISATGRSAERSSHQTAAPTTQQDDAGEHERCDQRRGAGLLIRGERDARDERPDRFPSVHDRARVEPLVGLGRRSTKPARPAAPTTRAAARSGMRARRLDRFGCRVKIQIGCRRAVVVAVSRI